MALDPDTKTLFDALLAGQVRQDAVITRLAEVQERTEATVQDVRKDVHDFRKDVQELRKDAASQGASLNRVAHLLSTLAGSHAELNEQVRNLAARVDSFAETVVRGFTDGNQRISDVEHGVDDLEREQ